MAREGLIQNNQKKKMLIQKYGEKRQSLKKIIYNKELSLEERFKATIALSELPRSSSPVRYRLRCVETGRARGVYRFCRLSRIKLREKTMRGALPGMCRASW